MKFGEVQPVYSCYRCGRMLVVRIDRRHIAPNTRSLLYECPHCPQVWLWHDLWHCYCCLARLPSWQGSSYWCLTCIEEYGFDPDVYTEVWAVAKWCAATGKALSETDPWPTASLTFQLGDTEYTALCMDSSGQRVWTCAVTDELGRRYNTPGYSKLGDLLSLVTQYQVKREHAHAGLPAEVVAE